MSCSQGRMLYSKHLLSACSCREHVQACILAGRITLCLCGSTYVHLRACADGAPLRAGLSGACARSLRCVLEPSCKWYASPAEACPVANPCRPAGATAAAARCQDDAGATSSSNEGCIRCNADKTRCEICEERWVLTSEGKCAQVGGTARSCPVQRRSRAPGA